MPKVLRGSDRSNCRFRRVRARSRRAIELATSVHVMIEARGEVIYTSQNERGWLGNRVVGVLDSGAEGPRFKLQSRRCRITVLGKLFTPIVSLFTKQQN